MEPTKIDGIYEYFAFISYTEEDTKVAQSLCDELERFKLPTSVRKEKKVPKYLRPIYEYKKKGSAEDLRQHQIALGQSRYLIVICSPESRKSDWVKKAVDYFKDNRGERFIIPLIASGKVHASDPNEECFPERLLKNGDERQSERRGINPKEEGGIKMSAIKIISYMIGVSYTSLWDKYQKEERRIRWFNYGLLIALIVVFSGLFIDSCSQREKAQKAEKAEKAQRIIAEERTKVAEMEREKAQKAEEAEKEQREIAEARTKEAERAMGAEKEQREIAEARTKEAERERENATKEKENALIAHSLAMAELSMNSIDQGELDKGLYFAMAGFPSDLENPERPLVPRAEYALRKAVNSFTEPGIHESTMMYQEKIRTGSYYIFRPKGGIFFTRKDSIFYISEKAEPLFLYSIKSMISNMKFDGNGKRLFVETIDDSLHVLDVAKKEIINSFYAPVNDYDINPIDNSFVTILDKKDENFSITKWDKNGFSQDSIFIPWDKRDWHYNRVKYNPQGSKIAFCSDTIVYVYDANLRVEEKKLPICCDHIHNFQWNESGNKMIVLTLNSDPRKKIHFNETPSSIMVYDTNTWDLVMEKTDDHLIHNACLSPISDAVVYITTKDLIILDGNNGNTLGRVELKNGQSFSSTLLVRQTKDGNYGIWTSTYPDGLRNYDFIKRRPFFSTLDLNGLKPENVILSSSDISFVTTVKDSIDRHTWDLYYIHDKPKQIFGGYYGVFDPVFKFSSDDGFLGISSRFANSFLIFNLKEGTDVSIAGIHGIKQFDFNPVKDECAFITEDSLYI